MVAFFVMLVLIVQVGFLVSTQSIVGAAVDASVRRTSADAGTVHTQKARLIRDLEASVPGADIEEVEFAVEGNTVQATVRYRLRPPGPDLAQVALTVHRERVIVVPP